MIAAEMALRAVLNVLRDSIEVGRMPSGLTLAPEAIKVHRAVIAECERLLAATPWDQRLAAEIVALLRGFRLALSSDAPGAQPWIKPWISRTATVENSGISMRYAAIMVPAPGAILLRCQSTLLRLGGAIFVVLRSTSTGLTCQRTIGRPIQLKGEPAWCSASAPGW